LGVQDQIAQRVTQALEVRLGARERRLLAKQGTRDPEAYRLYQRARFLWNTRTGRDTSAPSSTSVARSSATRAMPMRTPGSPTRTSRHVSSIWRTRPKRRSTRG
jgi:hypothetical protein